MNGIEKSDAAGPYPDEQYMRRAIELAKRGSGHVNPNPLVGAVIVRDGEILGEGWHEEYGELPAARNAIAHAVAEGRRQFRRIVIAGKGVDFCVPCGICRQVLNEFSDNMRVLCGQYGQDFDVVPLAELLPHSFGPEHLGVQEDSDGK